MRAKWGLPLLAFLVPLIYRIALELYSNPFTVGYDTLVFYLPHITGFYSPSPVELYGYAPLYYIIAYAAKSILGDPLTAIKVLAIALQGLFGLSLFLWSSTILTRQKALIFSLTASFFFTTLRIAWDLHRNALGLTLMLLTLFSLEMIKGRRSQIIIASSLGILTALCNPLIPPILIMMLLPKLLRREKISILISSTTMAVWLSTLIAQFMSKSSLSDTMFAHLIPLGSSSLFPSGLIGLEFFAYIMVPLLPLFLLCALSGRMNKYMYKKTIPALIWLIFCIILGLTTGIGFRFLLMAPIPAIFLIVFYSGRKTQVVLIGVVVVLSIGYSTYGTFNPFPYFTSPWMWHSEFLNAVPSSMLQNTVPLEDSQTVINLFGDLRATINEYNDSRLLVFRPMLSYAILSDISPSKIILFDVIFNNTELTNYLHEGYNIYTIWWKPGYQWYGLDMAEFEGANFSINATSGDYAIYYIKGFKN